MSKRIGTTESVIVDGNVITGKVYNVRDNGWACVETDTGRCASGPSYTPGPALVQVWSKGF